MSGIVERLRNGGWIAVSEQLPALDTDVLLLFAGNKLPTTGRRFRKVSGDGYGWDYLHPDEEESGDIDLIVSHWQPLPIAQADLADIAEEMLRALQQALYVLKGREHDGFLRDAILRATGEPAVLMRSAQRNPLLHDQIAAWADEFIRNDAYNRGIAVQIAERAVRWAEHQHGIGGSRATGEPK